MLGVDCSGIVNIIICYVSSCGCNIEDSCLVMLGEEFMFIMLFFGLWNVIILIELMLLLKGVELDFLIVMKCMMVCLCLLMLVFVWV